MSDQELQGPAELGADAEPPVREQLHPRQDSEGAAERGHRQGPQTQGRPEGGRRSGHRPRRRRRAQTVVPVGSRSASLSLSLSLSLYIVH